MGYREEELWASTPKKFFAMLNCAMEFKKKTSAGNGGMSSDVREVVDGTIDDLDW